VAAYRRLDSDSVREGAIIVRIVHSGGEPRATVRQVEKGTALGDVHPSEEMAVEEALRLAGNKRAGGAQDEILIELEPGISWRPEWGQLIS
jgi:ribosomal protein L16/L10AE